MKEYKHNFSDGKDATLQIPDDMELDMQFSEGLIGIELQDAIAKGLCRVTERVWPCLYCNRKFLAQPKLQAHLLSHDHNNLRKKVHQHLGHVTTAREEP